MNFRRKRRGVLFRNMVLSCATVVSLSACFGSYSEYNGGETSTGSVTSQDNVQIPTLSAKSAPVHGEMTITYQQAAHLQSASGSFMVGADNSNDVVHISHIGTANLPADVNIQYFDTANPDSCINDKGVGMSLTPGKSCTLTYILSSDKAQKVEGALNINITGAITKTISKKISTEFKERKELHNQLTASMSRIVPGGSVVLKVKNNSKERLNTVVIQFSGLSNADQSALLSLITISPDSDLPVVTTQREIVIPEIAPQASKEIKFSIQGGKVARVLLTKLKDQLSLQNAITVDAGNSVEYAMPVSVNNLPILIPALNITQPGTNELIIQNLSRERVILANNIDKVSLPYGVSYNQQKSTCKNAYILEGGSNCKLVFDTSIDAYNTNGIPKALDFKFTTASDDSASSIDQTPQALVNVSQVTVAPGDGKTNHILLNQAPEHSSSEVETTVKLTNMGAFTWHPSNNQDDYKVLTGDTLSVNSIRIVNNECVSASQLGVAPKSSCNLTFQVSGGVSSISSPSQLELVKRNNLAQDTVIPIDIKSSQDNSIKTNLSADHQMLAVKAIDILNDGKNPLNISTTITNDTNNAEEFQIWDGKTAVKWCSQGTCPNACPITIENDKGLMSNLASEKSCKLYIYSSGNPEKSLDASLNITATNVNKDYKATDVYSLHAVQNLYATGYINTASNVNLSLYKAALPELQSFQVISPDAPKLQTPSYGLSVSPNGQVLIANGQNLYQYDFVHQHIVKLPDLGISGDDGYISAIAVTNDGIYVGTKNKIYLYQFNHFEDTASLVSEITEAKSQLSDTSQNDISGIALSYKDNNPDQIYYVDTGSITIHKGDSALSQAPNTFASYVVLGASYPTYSLIHNQSKIKSVLESERFFMGVKLPSNSTIGSYDVNTKSFLPLKDEKKSDISIDPAHSDAHPLALAQTVGDDGTPLNTYVTTSKSNKVFVYGNQNAHYLQETNLSYPNTSDNKEVTAMRLAVGAELSVSRMLEHRL